MNVLEGTYSALKDLGLCKTGYQFSREFLGRAPNYYSVIKANDKAPSVAVMTTLYYSLVRQSVLLESSDNAVIVRVRDRVDKLCHKVNSSIHERCLGY